MNLHYIYVYNEPLYMCVCVCVMNQFLPNRVAFVYANTILVEFNVKLQLYGADPDGCAV